MKEDAGLFMDTEAVFTIQTPSRSTLCNVTATGLDKYPLENGANKSRHRLLFRPVTFWFNDFRLL